LGRDNHLVGLLSHRAPQHVWMSSASYMSLALMVHPIRSYVRSAGLVNTARLLSYESGKELFSLRVTTFSQCPAFARLDLIAAIKVLRDMMSMFPPTYLAIASHYIKSHRSNRAPHAICRSPPPPIASGHGILSRGFFHSNRPVWAISIRVPQVLYAILILGRLIGTDIALLSQVYIHNMRCAYHAPPVLHSKH
jgi:hypothetical protein